MATAASFNEFGGQVLQCAKYTWKLGRCVGRGTCSVVVEAVGSFSSNTKHRRPQYIKGAVKIFKQGQRFEAAGANEMEILEYLRRQGEVSKYKCQYIAQLMDYFSYKGLLHLAYARLSCNLHHVLLKNSNKGLPLYIIKECARHILEALRFLATNMVVHGDIKMSNIMWNANRGIFQLVDFGLSFVKGNQPYQPLQSPGYQSPEARVWNRLLVEGMADRSNSQCCCASDMWSFANVLWYMYTGTPAPRCETDNSVCSICLKEEPGPCIHSKKFKDQLPRDGRKVTTEQHELFCDFLMRMIKCKPEQRITPSDAIQHKFLEYTNLSIPSLSDMMLLPTSTLLLDNIYPENADCLKDVEEMCARFGVVRQITGGSDGKVLVEYCDADDCSQAHSALTGWIYNGRTVITCFYPPDKSSTPDLFNSVIPRQQASHDNERLDTLGKRNVDLEPESPKNNYAKCMKTGNENFDVDLEVNPSKMSLQIGLP